MGRRLVIIIVIKFSRKKFTITKLASNIVINGIK